MNKRSIISFLFLLIATHVKGQGSAGFADSIRKVYNIPELNYAVVSSDSILEMYSLGYKKIGSDRKSDIHDLFRIGSNTKAITGFIAALLVKEVKISWDTRFFDLFPELKKNANPAYSNLNLLDLLTFRTRLPRYTYTNKFPTETQFTGSEEQQRYQFILWSLKQKPVPITKDIMSYSNLGYVIAGLMLGKVSGKPYKELVADLGKKLNIHFYFGQPNNIDTLQPWGHNEHLIPEPPGQNNKLDWLLPAGNITISLPDYARFIQLQLQGLAGKSDLLSANEFKLLHYGRPEFSLGWFYNSDDSGNVFTHNTGNPGTFLTNVYVFGAQNKAIIIFANAQTGRAEEGENLLFEQLRKIYIP